jgi:hypothetical protein
VILFKKQWNKLDRCEVTKISAECTFVDKLVHLGNNGTLKRIEVPIVIHFKTPNTYCGNMTKVSYQM